MCGCSTMKIRVFSTVIKASFIAEIALVIRRAKSHRAILVVTMAREPSMSSCFVFFSLFVFSFLYIQLLLFYKYIQ
jgi:hypothetical protein